MKKFYSCFLILTLLTFFTTLELPAKAEVVCITDPTGTPLNVRDRPNGKVINTLKNGREVNIQEIASDAKGRAWAKVGGYYNGKYRVWGWVLREYISCYNR